MSEVENQVSLLGFVGWALNSGPAALPHGLQTRAT